MLPLPIGEDLELAKPLQLYRSGLAVAVFGDNALCHTLFFRVFIIIFIPVQEHDRVGVLLNGTGFPKI